MSISKKNAVSIAVTRKDRTKDGAGGYTTTSSAITGSPFTGRKIRRVNKQAILVDGRPGDIQIDQIILVFALGVDVRIGDVCTVGTKSYTVRSVREYSRSIQADVEMVK